MDENKSEVIDLRKVGKSILGKKRLFLIVWLVTFIVSCIIILPVPRTYDATTVVAPENTSTDVSSLSSIASSFGFNIGDMNSTDAFYPEIYPDVMASNDFIVGLLSIRVKSADGEIDTDYYSYLTKHQKKTFYSVPYYWCKSQIRKLSEKKKANANLKDTVTNINPFMLSEKQTMIFELIRNTVTCSYDKKTGEISIKVTDQDPLICATLADSARVHLQDFITRYRTNKARIDYDYYREITDEAKADYDKSVREYSLFCDSHMNSLLEVTNSKRDELENDMSMKMNTYNTMKAQLAAAKAKIQECTPAFSLLQSPTVPVKPTGPKRMIFVIAMLFFATVLTIGYIFKKDILNNLYKKDSADTETDDD